MLGEVLASNRFYRQRLPGLAPGELRTLEDVARLPAMSKADLAADQAAEPPFGANLTYGPERYTRWFKTSGTTGAPINWLETNDSIRWNAGLWLTGLRAIGVQPADRLYFAFTFGPFLAFWGAWEGAHLLGAYCLSGGGGSSLHRLEAIQQSSATVLLGTPTYVLHLANAAREHGIDAASTTIAKTVHGGEPGPCIPSTKKTLEDAWGAKCFDTAGATESGHFGFECAAQPGGIHLNEGEFIFEFLGDDQKPIADGQEGELVITNLGRPGMPLIRYRTGDRVRPNHTRCECGRTFVRLDGGILGRVDDMVVVKGVNIFPSAIENIVRRHDAFVEFRLTVDKRRPGDPELLLELEPDPAAGDAGASLEAVRRDLRMSLPITLPVQTVTPGTLPRFELKARRMVILS